MISSVSCCSDGFPTVFDRRVPSGIYKKLWKIAIEIEIVEFPIKKWWFSHSYVSLPECTAWGSLVSHVFFHNLPAMNCPYLPIFSPKSHRFPIASPFVPIHFPNKIHPLFQISPIFVFHKIPVNFLYPVIYSWLTLFTHYSNGDFP